MRKLLTLFTALLFVGTMWGDVISVTIYDGTESDYASTHSWTNGTQYDQVVLDANITANRIGTTNNGKYYTDWRFYTNGSNNGSFSIDAANGCTLDSVTFTYTVSNSGALYQGSTQLNSGTKYKISGSSVTYQVKNTNSSTNGQVRLTAIRVVYTVPSTDPSVTLDPTSINFGNVALGASVATQEITVLGENLTSALTATSSNTDVFTIAVKAGDSLTPDEGEVLASLVITPITTAYGDFNETITISGGGLEEDSIVPISMHVGGIVTVTPASPNLAFGEIPQNADAENYAKTITVSATNLTAYKEIRVQAPLYFQASPINISADENGIIEATEVKLMPVTTYDAGDYGDVDAKFELVSTSPREFAGIEIGAPTMTIVSCSPLDAPTLGTLSKSYDYANITWTAVEHTTEYIFTLTEHNGEPRTPLHTPNLGTEMLNLKANTQYDYTVQAVGDGTTYCESNPLLEGSFTTDDYPAATLTLSENGVEHAFAGSHKLTDVVTLPSEVETGVVGKVLVGWDANSTCATAPTYAKGANYTLASTTQKLYAVYATETKASETPHDVFATTSLGSTNTVTDGYEVGAAAEAKSGYYQDGSGTARYVQVKVKETATQIIASEPSAITVNATIGGGTTKDPLGNNVYAQFLDASGNVLGDPVVVTTKVEVTTGKEYEVSMPVANYANVRGVRISHVKETGYNVRYYAISLSYTTAVYTYSDYATSGPRVLANPTFTPAQGTYTSAQNITISAAEGTIYYTLDGTDPTDESTEYTGAIALDTYGEHTIKAIAIDGSGNQSEVVSATYMLKLPFASLEALVAQELPTGTQVTVSFSNVAITEITNSNRSVYLNVKDKDGENNIQLFNYTALEEAWAVNGRLSGNNVEGTWTLYNEKWELVISSWTTGITYNDPATAIDNTEVEGKAVKVLRNGVLYIEKNGRLFNAQGQLIK